MTRQKRATPKSKWLCRLTIANYDFLCIKAMREGTSMAKLLNEILEVHRSGIKVCNHNPERIQVN
jgi:hypothetical protein